MDSTGCTNGSVDGPDHVRICDVGGGQPIGRGAGLRTVRLQARSKVFTLVHLQGQLFVCTRQNGSRCCGWEEKGRLPFDPGAQWGDQ